MYIVDCHFLNSLKVCGQDPVPRPLTYKIRVGLVKLRSVRQARRMPDGQKFYARRRSGALEADANK